MNTTHMNFYILAKLLHSSTLQLFAGYVVFALSIFVLSISMLKQQPAASLHFTLLIMVTAIMALHHYLGLRVKFDANLVHYLSTAQESEQLQQLTQQMDESLIQLKLMPQAKAGRDWNTRFQGCKTLFHAQITVLILQFIALISSMLIQYS